MRSDWPLIVATIEDLRKSCFDLRLWPVKFDWLDRLTWFGAVARQILYWCASTFETLLYTFGVAAVAYLGNFGKIPESAETRWVRENRILCVEYMYDFGDYRCEIWRWISWFSNSKNWMLMRFSIGFEVDFRRLEIRSYNFWKQIFHFSLWDYLRLMMKLIKWWNKILLLVKIKVCDGKWSDKNMDKLIFLHIVKMCKKIFWWKHLSC